MHVVTLIHGTWARNATWTLEGSGLRTTIEEKLGPSTVVFERFGWSGKNSIRGREKAAIDLRAFLRNLLVKYPTASHSIIAHSHGGNIALRALEGQSELRAQIATIVTLATPFIAASVRETPKLRFAAGFPIKTVLWVLLLAFPIEVAQLVADQSLVLLFLVLAQILLATVLCGVLFAGSRLADEFRSQAELRASFWRTSPVCDLKLLVIRAAADEASLALNFLQFAIFSGNVLWEFPVALAKSVGLVLTRTEGWFKKNRGRYFCLTALLGFGLSLPYLVLARPVPWGAYLVIPLAFSVAAPLTIMVLAFSLQFLSILGIAALTLLACVLFSPVGLVAALSTVPFGLFDIFTSPFLRVTVEAAPPGIARIVQLPPRHASGLMHSTPFEDPQSIAATASWLSGRPLSGWE